MKVTIVFLYLGVMAAGLFGWAMNVYKLIFASPSFTEWQILEALRLVGIFLAPMGTLLGYF